MAMMVMMALKATMAMIQQAVIAEGSSAMANSWEDRTARSVAAASDGFDQGNQTFVIEESSDSKGALPAGPTTGLWR